MVSFEELFPKGYEVFDNGLYLVKHHRGNEEQILICNFVPYIVSEIICDDGLELSRKYEVEGIDKHGELLPRIVISEKEFANMDWVRNKWGLVCNIAPDSSAVKRLRYAMQETAEHAEKKYIYLTTGWHKINGKWHYLMPGDNKYTVELPGRLSGYSFRREKDIEALKLIPTLLNSVAPERVMYPLVAYAFLSAMNTFLKEAGYEPKTILMLLGKTGSKKSTLAALILSFFGSFSVTDLPMSFRDTANSIELFMYYLSDTLTCVDDLHPVKTLEKSKMFTLIQMICRLIGNRSARGRLNSNCDYRKDRIPKCNAIVTAEFLPDIGESGTARFIPLRLNHGDIDNKGLTIFQDIASDGGLSCIMYQFTEYLKEKKLKDNESEKGFIKELRDTHNTLRNYFKQTAEKRNIILRDRLIDDLTALKTGALYMSDFLKSNGVISAEEQKNMLEKFTDILIEVGAEQQDITITDQPTHIFIRKLQTLIDAKQVTMIDRNSDELDFRDSKFIGYYDNDNYYFDKSLAHKAVKNLCKEQDEDFVISEKGLREALHNEGISICDDGINLKKIRYKNSFLRCICIPKDVMRSIADDDKMPEEDLPFGPGIVEELPEQLSL